jgi:hypothetical protein
MDTGLEWKRQMWMGCESCWRGRVYAYMEQRKAKQTAADGLPERAVVRSQNKLSFIISVFLPLPDHPADLPLEAISHL